MNQAAILCGGLGTRLGALTADTPKPLLEVAGVPFLDHVIRRLVGYGVDRILLLAGFESMKVVEYARDADQRLGVQIYASIEPEPAGTGGALRIAAHRLGDVFIVANGDTLFDVDPRILLDELDRTTSALGIVALRSNGLGGGMYAIRREFVIDHLTTNRDLDQAVVASGRFIGVLFDDAYFVDIGTLTELERARRELTKYGEIHDVI